MTGLLSNLFRGKGQEQESCSVVIAAAGNSSRMKGADKILLPIEEVPVLARTLIAISSSPRVSEIIVVVRKDILERVSKLCQAYNIEKVRKVVCGGKTRTESVYYGIREVCNDAKYIAIHDGARPFVTKDLIEQVLDAAIEKGAAAPAVPVKDTVKRAVNSFVTATPNRKELFAVQTPQIFDADLIRGALEKAIQDSLSITDDCSAVEQLGATVCLVPGDDCNIKITTPTDLLFAEGILQGRS